MKTIKKVLFTATVDSHIMQFHLPYLKWFKEQGYEVHVATNGTQNIPYCDVKHVVPFERKPIKINNLKAIKILKQIVNKEKFSIIHCHTPMGGVVTRLASKDMRKNGTRVIYTAHGFHFYKGAPIINWLIYYPVEWYLSKYTDTLITINKEDFERANKKFAKRCKDIQFVQGIGVDCSRFSTKLSKNEKHKLRKSIGLDDTDFVLIQIGELNKNKNQIMAIKVMKEIVKTNTKIHLLIVGTGKLEKKYKNEIEKANLTNNVHMLGYRYDIPNLLKISNILLSLSYREGLPVNVMEAMSAGLPVIGTNCRGNRDLIAKDDLVNINDFIKLTKRIQDKIKTNKEIKYKNIEEISLNNIMESMLAIYKT